MKFVFCTDEEFNYYYKNIYNNKNEIFKASLNTLKDQNNPLSEVCRILDYYTFDFFIDDNMYYISVAKAINDTELAFFQVMDLLYKFYNGSDVFITVVDKEDLNVADVIGWFFENTFGINCYITDEITEEIENVESDFSEDGANIFELNRPMYFKLLAKTQSGLPLARFAKKDRVSAVTMRPRNV